MLLPSRMAVLNHMFTETEVDVTQVMSALEPLYGSEKQFTVKMYTEHLMALEANGLVELSSYDLDQTDELVMRYAITDDGRHAVKKYVDKKYQAV